MTNIDKQHEIVKASLFQFVNIHITAADLSVVDEIVLNYVISILEEASEDPNFDVEGFIEMMSAYFPDFSQIATPTVCEWLFQLGSEMKNEKASGQTPAKLIEKSFRLSDIIPESKLLSKSVSSDGGDSKTASEAGDISNSVECDFFIEECTALQEIFPDTSLLEIKHCIAIAGGDIERATQIVMDRQERGQSLIQSTLVTVCPQKNQKVDDNELKNRIISRYSYVDQNAVNKEYKPLTPKNEPKKMVRYLDNKIVSMKGERFTEIRKDGECELRKSKKEMTP